MRRPSGSDIVCFGRSLCGARSVMAAWKRAACLFLGSTPSRRSPSMRSSCSRHGGVYTAPLTAFALPSLLSLQPAREGTACLVCTHSIATSPRAESSERGYAAAAYDPWGTGRPAAAQPARSRVVCSPIPGHLFRAQLLTDAAPAHIMAANNKLARLAGRRSACARNTKSCSAGTAISTRRTRAGSTTRGKRAWPA